MTNSLPSRLAVLGIEKCMFVIVEEGEAISLVDAMESMAWADATCDPKHPLSQIHEYSSLLSIFVQNATNGKLVKASQSSLATPGTHHPFALINKFMVNLDEYH